LDEFIKKTASGEISPQEAAEALRVQTYEEMGFAKIDTDRAARTGHGEVVFCIGKTPDQAAKILKRMTELENPALPILATKAEPAHYEECLSIIDEEILKNKNLALNYQKQAKMIVISNQTAEQQKCSGKVAVVTAGTADIPIAEEAAITAELYAHTVNRIYDVGVAGLHRLLDRLEDIRANDVIIVVAGMEGALASVIAGQVKIPVIAVPTSVGYGVTLSGLTPLFAMLGGCSLGVSVMNIDNGFGAGHYASMLLDMKTEGKDE